MKLTIPEKMTQAEINQAHRIIRTLTFPARRHRCAICREVYECQLCTIRDHHPLHYYGTFACEQCCINQNVQTLACHGRTPGVENCLHEYDIFTGELIGVYSVRLWQQWFRYFIGSNSKMPGCSEKTVLMTNNRRRRA